MKNVHKIQNKKYTQKIISQLWYFEHYGYGGWKVIDNKVYYRHVGETWYPMNTGDVAYILGRWKSYGRSNPQKWAQE